MHENKINLRRYASIYFFMFAALAALFPYLPLLLQNKGFNPSQVGFIIGSYDLISIVGLMIIGHFFDKIRSPRSTITIIGLAVIITLFLLSRSTGYISLIAITLMLGFIVKSPTSLVDALFGLTVKNPGESYGKTRLGGSIGFLSMALLIQITQWVRGSDPTSIFTAYSICMMIALLFCRNLSTAYISFENNIEKKRDGFITTIKSFPKVFWIGLTIAFLNSLALSGHYTFFSLLLKNKFDLENVSGFWAIGPVLEIPLFFYSGFLLKKFKLKTLWIFCLMASIARLQMYSLADSLLPLYLIQLVHGLSFGLNHLCMINLITRKTQPSARGLAMSIFTAIGMGFSMFTGGILGGFILHSGDFELLFQVFSLFPLAAIPVVIIFLKE